MRGYIATFLFLEMHEGEIDDPEEFPVFRIAKFLSSFFKQGGSFQTDTAQYVTGALPSTSGEEHDVTISDFEFSLESFLFRIGKEFKDGRFPFASFGFNEGEPFGTQRFGSFFKVFQLTLGDVCKSLGIECFDCSA